MEERSDDMNAQEMRELDCWIAEHVLKLPLAIDPDVSTVSPLQLRWIHPQDGCLVSTPRKYETRDVYLHDWERFRPTEDPADAMAVLEKCARSTCEISLSFNWEAENGFHFTDGVDHGTGDTIPLAICLFARKLFDK